MSNKLKICTCTFKEHHVCMVYGLNKNVEKIVCSIYMLNIGYTVSIVFIYQYNVTFTNVCIMVCFCTWIVRMKINPMEKQLESHICM